MKQIVIMPGGFHPFHAGHAALYKSAVDAFPDAEVYVAATNDTKTRPFPFSIKEKLAKLAGVAPGHFVQVKSPFKSEEITSQYNPEEDVLIFVRSEKDRTEQPKPGGTKKDGTPAYFQPYTGKNLQPFSKHAYIAYLPTVEFGPGITSATEIRNAWPTLDDRRKTAMVMSLYPSTQKNPKLAANVVKMLDMGMGNELDEGLGSKLGAAALAGSIALGGLSQMGKTKDTNWNDYEQQISGQRDTTGGEKIMSVAGPNSKGEYRVRITTDNDMQEFITKTPPKSLEEDKETDPVTSAVLSFYKPVVNDIHKEKVDNYVDRARELLQKTDDPKVRSKLIDIFKKGKENPYIQGGIVTTVGAVLAGGILTTAQKMGLSPAQTNLALQAILNTVIPTVVSRINGKNWSDTIKYTLASAGIGTGIAGASLIENDPWGDQGNFAGDRPVNIGGSFTRTKLGVGDMVKVNAGHFKGIGEISEIKGDRAEVWMSSYSRSFVFDLSDLVKYIPESIDYLEEK
jgi:hypothetical protein